MKRWLRTRLLIVLILLALIPAATLPFADRLRDEWTKFWEPEPAEPEGLALESDLLIYISGVYVSPADGSDVPWIGMQPVQEEIPIVAIEPLGTVAGDDDKQP